MSEPGSKDLVNYGTQISKGFYGRKLYNDESGEALTIIHKSNKAIEIYSGSITMGSSLTGKNVLFNEGTLSTQHITGTTITDGTTVLKAGLITGLKSVTSSSFTDGIATLTNGTFTNLRSVSSNTLTDGIAILQSGTLSALRSVSSNTLTDGVASLYQGSLTAGLFVDMDIASITKIIQATSITDNVSSLTGGHFLGLKSVVSNSISDSTALLYEGSLTGGLFVDMDIASITKIIQAKSITDNVASLTGGNFLGLKSVVSNSISDSTALLYEGSLTGGLFVDMDIASITKIIQATSITDNVSSLTGGHFLGLKSVVSNSISDSTALLYEGSLTGGLFVDMDIASITKIIQATSITDNVSSLTGGHFLGLKSVVSNSISDSTALLYEGSLTGGLFVDMDIASITKIIQATSITDNVSSLTGGIFLGLKYVSSSSFTDGTAMLGQASLTGVLFTGSKVASVTETIYGSTITDNVATLKGGSLSGLNLVSSTTITGVLYGQMMIASVTSNLSVSSITDGTATWTQGSLSGLSHVASQLGSITKTLYASTITDNVSSLSGGIFLGLKSVNSSSFTDGVATLTNGTFTNLRSVSSNTLTDGVASLYQGSLTAGLFVDMDVASITKIIQATSITDNVSSLTGGYFLGLKSVVSNSISDSTALLYEGSLTGGLFVDMDIASITKIIQATSITDNVASLTGGNFLGLKSVVSNSISDGTALLYEASLTGGLFVDMDVASITKIIQATSITDNVSSLTGGYFLGLKSVVSNSISDSTALLYEGSLTGGLFVDMDIASITKIIQATSITDNVASLTGGNFLGLKSVVSNSISDGTALLYEASLTGGLFVDMDVASITKIIQATSITDNVSSLTGGYFLGLKSVVSNSISDSTALLYEGSLTGGLFVDMDIASITKIIQATSITDNVASLTGGIFLGLKSVNSSSFTDGIATLTNGTFTNLRSVSSNTFTDGVASLYQASLTGGLFVHTAIGSVTGTVFAGTVTSRQMNDGTITINAGTLSCSGNTGFIESNIGSFTNLYANDLFVEADMVVNGTTTYVNTSQTSFEDELISLGASDGRSVASVSGSVVYLETDATAAYTGSSYVLCMKTDGTKEIIGVASYTNNAVTLDSAPNASTTYIALISTESITDGAGIELLAHNAGSSRIKTFHYVNGSQSMEVVSAGAALDIRVSNASSVSYFSVVDNSSHLRLLTANALYLNTSDDGTITGGNEKPALYLSKNAAADAAAVADDTGDWRIRSVGTTSAQSLTFERYDSGSWVTRWQLE